jgi:hypothetical protein
VRAEDETTEERLKGGVGCVRRDDVEDCFRDFEVKGLLVFGNWLIKGGRGTELGVDEIFEVVLCERAGPGSEELRVICQIGEAFGGGHDAL